MIRIPYTEAVIHNDVTLAQSTNRDYIISVGNSFDHNSSCSILKGCAS